MLQFNYRYFIFFILLFVVEVFIALFVHDAIIRPHVGDVLVVMLLYCFLKAFVKIANQKATLLVLLFAYLIETLQYFKIVNILGLRHSTLARVVIGTSFSWIDIIAYTLGAGLILLTEAVTAKRPVG